MNAGGLASAFQPDFNGLPYASTQRLYGIGAYVDVHFNRWVQIEAEGRWSRFNQYYESPSSTGNGEDTYLIGPRLPIVTYHHFTPYGKVLVGMASGSFLDGHPLVIAYGGGVDYRLSRRFTLRAFDFEYQQWHTTPTIWPYGGSVGLSYKVF